MRIAVVGSGIAGNAAAWTLSKRYPVTVYEREIRPGGHSHTVNVDYDGTPIAVDVEHGDVSPAGIRQTHEKRFYVSPFIEMAMRYHFCAFSRPTAKARSSRQPSSVTGEF